MSHEKSVRAGITDTKEQVVLATDIHSPQFQRLEANVRMLADLFIVRNQFLTGSPQPS